MKITFDTDRMTFTDIDEVISLLSEAKECNHYAQSINSIFEAFEALSPELYKTKRGKNILKKYIAEVKADKSAKSLYSLCEAVYRAEKGTDASYLVSEAIAMTPKVSKFDDKALRRVLTEAISYIGLEKAKILIEDSSEKASVCSALNYLMSEEKNLKNLSEYALNFSVVTSYINEHAGENIRIKHEKSNVELDKLVREFNEACKGINASEKALISEIANATDKKAVFEKYKNKCLSAINESIKNNINNVDCDRLVEIKKGVEYKSFNDTTLGADVHNFIELERLVKD